MMQEAAREVRLVAGPEAGSGRATSPEVVWAQCASDGLARGLHDGPLDSRVAERFAASPIHSPPVRTFRASPLSSSSPIMNSHRPSKIGRARVRYTAIAWLRCFGTGRSSAAPD